MQRLANPKDGGQYAFYYTVIKGWEDYAAGKAKTISGHLDARRQHDRLPPDEAATGDFNYRMSMPATAPIPAEVAKCFEGKPGNYGRDVVSSGPYMLQGADKVSASSCAGLKPMSGYDGADGTHIILVRNPNYDQATDQYRKNYPDRFTFTVDSNADDIYNKVAAGQLDDELRASSRRRSAQYVDRSEPEKAVDAERRRPHVLRHDEPDAAAVRRHPHPQGDELDSRQEGDAEGLGWPGRRARSQPTSCRRFSTTTA